MSDSRYRHHGTESQAANIPRATERDALMPKPKQPYSLQKWLKENVRRHRADWVLIFAYTATGLLDSTATTTWGSFVSMQTGNTIYFGLGVTNPGHSTRWIKSGCSLISFCLGSFCWGHFHDIFPRRARWVLICSVLAQVLLCLVASIIVTLTDNEDVLESMSWHVFVPLCLVAFQSAGQAVISRALEFPALSTVVLTSIYCDLFSDARLFAGLYDNDDRNRRVAAPIFLLIGALIGGVLARTGFGIASALWMATGLKSIGVMLWFFWPGAEDDEDDV